MRFRLVRTYVGPEGCFGTLAVDGEPPFAVTLERYFEEKAADDHTVIKPGISKCTLDRYHAGGYTTYEIQFEDKTHDRVLFHKGNKEHHSAGCILVAEYFHDFGSLDGVANSASGFNEFMGKAAGVPEFDLLVIEAKP